MPGVNSVPLPYSINRGPQLVNAKASGLKVYSPFKPLAQAQKSLKTGWSARGASSDYTRMNGP